MTASPKAPHRRTALRLHRRPAVVDLAIGHARLAANSPDRRDTPMTPDTLMIWLSAGKPLTRRRHPHALGTRLLHLDESVAAYIPEFARHGKEHITIRHLLTHTAGIRGIDASYPFATWNETLARICDTPPERNWIPGMKAGYHTHTSWYLLGELIRRLTGQPHECWIRDHLLLPLGMTDTFLAMDAAQYRDYGPRIGFLYDTSHSPATPLLNLDTELAASRPRPSASARGPIRQLARFYEMLRCGGALDGITILQEQTVHAMTMRQRVGLFDHTFRQTIDWGLGLIVNSFHYGPGIPTSSDPTPPTKPSATAAPSPPPASATPATDSSSPSSSRLPRRTAPRPPFATDADRPVRGFGLADTGA